MRAYKFEVGQQVRIRGNKASSTGCKANKGKLVTIKGRCPFTWAYELVELDGLWSESCFEAV